MYENSENQSIKPAHILMQLILSLVAEAKRHIGHRFITLGLDFVIVV